MPEFGGIPHSANVTVQNERAKAADTPLTSACPAWLRPSGASHKGTAKFAIIPERAEIVRRIFRDTIAGASAHSIALALQAERVPMFGRGKSWHRGYIIKILTHPAVIGTNEFPAVIDREVFQRVQSLRRGAKSPMRGEHAGKEVQNIFGGLTRCTRCGSTMIRSSRRSGTKRWNYLLCSTAKTGSGCIYELVPYEKVETAFLENARTLIANAPSGSDRRKALDAEIKAVAAQRQSIVDRLNKSLDAMKAAPSVSLARQIREVEDERDELDEKLSDLAGQSAETSSGLVRRELAELRDAVSAKPLNRTLVNTMLRQALSSVDVDTANGLLLFNWKHGGFSELAYTTVLERQSSERERWDPLESEDKKPRQREEC